MKLFLESATDDVFYAETYAEYLESCAYSYSDLLNAIDEVTSAEDINYSMPGLPNPVTSLDEAIQICQAVIDNMRTSILDYATEQAAIDHVDLTTIPLGSATAKPYIQNGINHYSYVLHQWLTNDGYNELYDHFQTNGWIDKDYDIFTRYFIDIQAIYNNIITSVKTNIFNDSEFNMHIFVPFNEGYVFLTDLLKECFYKANSIKEAFDDVLNIPCYDNVGTALANANLTIKNVLQQVKANMESAMATASGLRAMAVNTIQERLAIFEENMRLFFAKTTSTFSNMTNLIRNKITDLTMGIASFNSWLQDLIDVDVIATEDNTTYSDTKSVQYTGASPNIVIDWDLFRKGVITTGKIIAQATKTIWSVLLDFAGSIFTKVNDKLTETFTDPIDLVPIENGSNSGLVDGFCYDFDEVVYLADDEQGDNCRLLYENSSKFTDKWLKFHFYFGELLVQPTRMIVDDNILVTEAHFKFKPRPISKDAIGILSNMNLGLHQNDPTGQGTYITYTYSWTEIQQHPEYIDQWNKALKSFNCTYCSPDASEQELFNGYNFALQLLCLNVACQSIYDQGRDYLFDDTILNHEGEKLIGKLGVVYYRDPQAHPVNNLSFVKMCAGFDGSTHFDKEYHDQWHDATAGAPCNDAYGAKRAICAMLGFYAASFVDKILNPRSFQFVPYSNNKTDFSDPQYRIKSDEENQAAVTKFLTIATAVVIGIAAIATVGVIIKLRKINRYAKLNRKAGVLDSKMWEGGKLTPLQRLTYYRANKKLEKMNLVGEGLSMLSGIAGVSENTNTILSNVNDITDLSKSGWKADDDNTLLGKIDSIDVDAAAIQEIRNLIA